MTSDGLKIIKEEEVIEDYITIELPMWQVLKRLDVKEEKIVKPEKIGNKVVNKTVGRRVIYQPVFWKQGIFIYVLAYDTNSKKLYGAFWSASIDPYYNSTVNICLEVKQLTSYTTKTVGGDKVPAPGQTRVKYVRGPDAFGIAIPTHTQYKLNIPPGMPINVDTKRKIWWLVSETDPTDPNSEWEEDSWEIVGYRTVDVDEGLQTGWSSSVHAKWYVYRVKIIMSTFAESSPVYHVILLVYADDTDDEHFSSDYWYPSGGSQVAQKVRNDTSPYTENLFTQVRIRYATVSSQFGSIIDDDIKITLGTSSALTLEEDRGYFQIRVPDWSQVPSQYNYLKIYRISKGFIRAQFSG